MGIESKPPVNGDFVNEGTFLAMPPCFPGVSLPPPADELRMKGVQLSMDKKMVFATTWGPSPHLLQFLPKGSFGYAVDLGHPVGATEITAMVAMRGKNAEPIVLACTSESGAFLSIGRAAFADTGIQEWSVNRLKMTERLNLPVPHLNGITCSDDKVFAWGSGEGFFLRRDTNFLVLEKVIKFENVFPETVVNGNLLTSNFDLISIDWVKGGLSVQVSLPRPERPVVVLEGFPGGAVWSDDRGIIHELTGNGYVIQGAIPILPVHSLCRVPDGRIYVSAGADIAHWFVLEKNAEWARDLGVPVSTLSTRRYGFQFSQLIVGLDGEIYAAENDRGGHLWIYFPSSR